MTIPSNADNRIRVPNSGLVHVKNIIAISSCKGGVGKSTIAAAIAKSLAKDNVKVGLLDGDIFGPSVPTLFNIHNVEVLGTEEGKIIPLIVEGIKMISFGFLASGKPAVMRGPMVANYLQNLLHNVEWGELDYLIIDMPPGTGDIQLTLTQTVQLDGAVIVTTKQSLALEDVAKGIMMFEQVKVPMLGIVENMSYFVCDQCSKKHDIFGIDTPHNTLTDRFGLQTLAQIPLIQDLNQLFENAADHEVIHTMTKNILEALEHAKQYGDVTPSIDFNESSITLTWSDGTACTINNLELRYNCKCAMCTHEYSGKKLIDKNIIRKDIAPIEINKFGNYAISVKWNDGHSTGIYPYDNIKNLVTV